MPEGSSSQTAVAAAPRAGSRARQVVADYVEMTKPKVQSLLIFTTVTTMYIAGDPSIGLVLLTCLGGYLSAGGAGAVNHWYDRDIDAQMGRTADRPVASGRVSPRAALIYGIALATLAFVVLAVGVNPLAAVLSLSGFLGYTLVYTMWLKRSTPQNIVIGGAAGAFPPMIGWAAVTGDVTLMPALLFTLIFLWTPPHFWALSLFVRSDYAAAGVPMLPVVSGPRVTRQQIAFYTLPMAAVAIAPWPLGLAGPIYGVAATLLSLVFAILSLQVLANPATEPAGMKPEKRLFAFSILYLFAIFGMLVADRWLLA